MIINVPIYLEIDGKFTPQEGRELTLYLRKSVIEFVRKSSNGYFTIDLPSGKKRVDILSETQAINRFGSGKKVSPQTPQEKPNNLSDFTVKKKGDFHE